MCACFKFMIDRVAEEAHATSPIVKHTSVSGCKVIIFLTFIWFPREAETKKQKKTRKGGNRSSLIINNISNFHYNTRDETCYLLVLLFNIVI